MEENLDRFTTIHTIHLLLPILQNLSQFLTPPTQNLRVDLPYIEYDFSIRINISNYF